jgi:hypothetical protein
MTYDSVKFKVGDQVRLIDDPHSLGTVVRIYWEDENKASRAKVYWDVPGRCIEEKFSQLEHV